MYMLVLELLFYYSVLLRSCDADECNVRFQSELATRTECFTTFGDCGFDKLQTRFPTLYNKTGWRRDPPSNIKATSFCEPNSSGVNDSGINIQWNLPNSQSAAGIAGYELRVEGDPPNFRCLVVVLEEKATPHNIHFVLNSTVYPLRRNINYMLVLHSLPRANNSEPESKDVLSMNCKRGSTSSDWVPAGHNFYYNWPERKLVVWFPAPPPEYNMSKFQLDLFSTGNGKTHKITNMTKVAFDDVQPGKYILYMQPYDEHMHDRKRCVCRDDENRCTSCQLSRWKIDAKKQEELSSSNIIIGVSCAFVALTITVILLYKLLAKRFGIECVNCRNSNRVKDDILHVMCIYGDSSHQEASKLRWILKNELKRKVEFGKVVASSDTDISSKVWTLWKKWKMETSSALGNDVFLDQPASWHILICLLVCNITSEKCSELLSKVQSNIPKTGPLHVQICFVTFIEKCVSFKCASVNCFALNNGSHTFINAIKKAFPDQTNRQNETCVYRDGTIKYRLTSQNEDEKSRRPFALQNSPATVKITSDVKDAVSTETNIRIPEVMYLGITELRRERYVSDDSGRGGSVLSNRTGHLHDSLNGLSQDADIQPKTDHQQVQPDRECVDGTQISEPGCHSCDISFYPPDPSVISENDFCSDIIESADTRNMYASQKFQKSKSLNGINGVKQTHACSMDSLMEKMAQINERSALIMQQDTKLGEVHSVWEGHV